MGRALHRLSAVGIGKLGPGMWNDGHGLYLRVSDTGTRSWIFRFTLGGKTRDMGLGATSVVSLAAARRRAQELRELRQARHRSYNASAVICGGCTGSAGEVRIVP